MKKIDIPWFRKIMPYVSNRYFLTLVGALIWISFFDRNDFLTTYSYHCKLKALQEKKLHYESEITRYKSDLANLKSSKNNLEKYAREKYFMKKDNEDIFRIVENRKNEKGAD